MVESKALLAKGIFVLSLDVELCWGTIDKPDKLNKYKIYYEKARECIEKILVLLEKYNISATWAIVGHLFLQECNATKGHKHLDILRSTYPWYLKDWFEECPCTNFEEAPLWYGQDIIKSIANCEIHQEIACHSFAHIPYGDENTRRSTVQSDLFNCVQEARKMNINLRSFVFPRNNIGYTEELKAFGFEAFRGQEPSWYSNFPKRLRKVCHILDQSLAISPPVCTPEINNGLVNIPASMFYLPMNGFRGLLPLSLRVVKAKKGIEKAITDKKVFHLWFHPFNIATNQEKLLYGLEEIFKEVQLRRETGEIEIRSMEEIVDLVKREMTSNNGCINVC